MTDTLYIWQVFEKGQWGTIAALSSDDVLVPLQHRTQKLAEKMEPLARNHGEQLGLPVRFARYVFDGEVS